MTELQRYYEEFGHHELYVSYVYKLYDLHILHSNELEAAKTLLRHTTMLTVSIFEFFGFRKNQFSKMFELSI